MRVASTQNAATAIAQHATGGIRGRNLAAASTASAMPSAKWSR
jgi:hypothetical protein